MTDVRSRLITFVETIRRPECSLDDLADDVNLFDTGVVDSLAVLKIVMYLEESYGIDLVASAVEPTELQSISSILDVIERHRQPSTS